MLKVMKNSRFTNVIAVFALVISLLTAGLLVSEAYVGRTSVLATILQSVGLCEAPDKSGTAATAPKPIPAQSESQSPTNEPDTSTNPASPEPATPEINSNPSDAPLKGVAGAPGTAGTPGTEGTTGATGSTGATGETGPAGAPGSTGAQGAPGVCDIAELLSVNGNLVPTLDNTYSLGTETLRWKSLQLGPGTLWIQDSVVVPPTQVAIRVANGAMLLDGADSLRVGNVRLTATGLTSELPNSPITLGDNSFNSYVQLQTNGLKFKDGTIQSTAALGGTIGPPGPQGPQGPQGPAGRDGSIEGFIEVPVCIIEDSPVYAKFTMVYPKCGDIEGKGRDIVILERKE